MKDKRRAILCFSRIQDAILLIEDAKQDTSGFGDVGDELDKALRALKVAEGYCHAEIFDIP